MTTISAYDMIHGELAAYGGGYKPEVALSKLDALGIDDLYVRGDPWISLFPVSRSGMDNLRELLAMWCAPAPPRVDASVTPPKTGWRTGARRAPGSHDRRRHHRRGSRRLAARR